MHSISAGLQAHRASILRDGARRFFVSPDIPDFVDLCRKPHLSISECLASAHEWLRSFRGSKFVPFLIMERACLGNCSVVASTREILIWTDRLAAPNLLRSEGGGDSRGGPKGLPKREPAGATPEAGNHQDKKPSNNHIWPDPLRLRSEGGKASERAGSRGRRPRSRTPSEANPERATIKEKQPLLPIFDNG